MDTQAVRPPNEENNVSQKTDSLAGSVFVYIVVVLLVILVIIGILTLLGPAIGNVFTNIVNVT